MTTILKSDLFRNFLGGFAIGAIAMFFAARRRSGKVTGTSLTADEKARLAALLKNETS